MAGPAPNKRSIIYIDGFNFYYGALKGGPNKWLNLDLYFRRLLPDDDIQVIRYFTAMVNGPPQTRQRVYLRALETLPNVQIILGRYKKKDVKCKVIACTHGGSRIFIGQEEKRTDVNIGVSMLDDAYQDLCDRLVIISGDSDLVPAVTKVRDRFPAKQILVYVPAQNEIRGAAVELRSVAHRHRLLPLNILPKSLFPAQVPDGFGGTIDKPASW